MKIAQVCPYFSPVEGGVENHVLNISLELSRRGHDVQIFTSARTRSRAPLPGRERLGKLLVNRFEPIGYLGEFGSVWPGFVPRILGGDFDVVHSHSFRHPHTYLSAAAAKAAGSATVLTGHSPLHSADVRGPMARVLVDVHDRLVAPSVIPAFDGVIAITSAEAEFVTKLGARRDRVVVIPNGVEEKHFLPPEPQIEDLQRAPWRSRTTILYLGRINRTKGIDVLVRAFARLAAKFPEPILVIAGPTTSDQEAQYGDILTTLVGSLGIADRVVFTGRLTEAEKAAALEGCSVFVLPSLYEPFGIVLLEAAAHGKLLIAARSDGPASIIRSGVNGLLVSPGSESELLEALTLVFGHPGSVNGLKEEARKDASNYRWSAVVNRIESLYSEVRRAK